MIISAFGSHRATNPFNNRPDLCRTRKAVLLRDSFKVQNGPGVRQIRHAAQVIEPHRRPASRTRPAALPSRNSDACFRLPPGTSEQKAIPAPVRPRCRSNAPEPLRSPQVRPRSQCRLGNSVSYSGVNIRITFSVTDVNPVFEPRRDFFADARHKRARRRAVKSLRASRSRSPG